MFHSRFFPLLAALTLLGAGCLSQAPSGPGSALVPPTEEKSAVKIPCLAFEHREGFAAWLDAYEANQADAVHLAAQAQLPEKADQKLIADMRASLNNGATPSFLCALDEEGKDITWVMEPPETSGKDCRDLFYVSVNGLGTVNDLTSNGRGTDCHQLCKPKRIEPDLLVWQCDIREADDKKTWSQMHMNRKTGEAEIVQCQKDKLGMPNGCIE